LNICEYSPTLFLLIIFLTELLDLAQKMIFLLQHWEERNTLATVAKERALREYSIEKHIANLKELYSSLCAA